MPKLKQLTCSVGLGPSQTKIKEYGARYSDGAVECFIPVPGTDIPFSIHLQSEGYIAPGLAMFVFMDGEYQCNRNRQRLRMPGPGVTPKDYEVEFVMRQKEEKTKSGGFVGREWTFAQLSTAKANNCPALNPNFIKNVGTIEVVVLRCSSEIEDLPPPHVARSVPRVEEREPSKHSARHSTKQVTEPAQDEGLFGGMFGIFDGAGDDPEPRNLKPAKVVDKDGRTEAYAPPGMRFDAVIGRYVPADGVCIPGIEAHNGFMGDHLPLGSSVRGPRSEIMQSAYGQPGVDGQGGHPQVVINNYPDRASQIGVFDRQSFRQPQSLYNQQMLPDYYQLPQQPYYHNAAGARDIPKFAAQAEPLPPQGMIGIEEADVPGHLQSLERQVRQWENKLDTMYALREGPTDRNWEERMLPECLKLEQRRKATLLYMQQMKQAVEGRGKRPSPPRSSASHQVHNFGGQWGSPGGGFQAVGEGVARPGAPRRQDDKEKQQHKADNTDDWVKGRAGGQSAAADGWAVASPQKAQSGAGDWAAGNDQQKQDNQGWSGGASSHKSKDHADPWSTGNGQQGGDAWGGENGSSHSKKSAGGWGQEPSQHGGSRQDKNGAEWGQREGSQHGGSRRSEANAPSWGDNGGGDANHDSGGNDVWATSEPKGQQDAGWSQQNQAANNDQAWGANDQQNNQSSNNDQTWGDGNQQKAASNAPSQARFSTASVAASARLKPYWADWRNTSTNPRDSADPNMKKKRDIARPVYDYPAEALPAIDTSKVSNGASYGVQAGRGADYYHRCHRPTYMDDMSKPYAVFSFKYRSKEVLEKTLKKKIDADLAPIVQQAEKDKLLSMPKTQLIDELMKLKISSKGKAAPASVKAGNEWGAAATSSKKGGSTWDAKPASVKADDSWGHAAGDQKPADSKSGDAWPSYDNKSHASNSTRRTKVSTKKATSAAVGWNSASPAKENAATGGWDTTPAPGAVGGWDGVNDPKPTPQQAKRSPDAMSGSNHVHRSGGGSLCNTDSYPFKPQQGVASVLGSLLDENPMAKYM